MIQTYTKNNKLMAKVEDLKPWADNPRDVSKESLQRLTEQLKLGTYKPILIQEDGTVLGGNMRLRAMKQVNMTEVWVSVIGFREVQGEYESTLNGVPTGKTFKTIRDGIWSYALSDNDRSGFYVVDQIIKQSEGLNIDINQFTIDIKEPTPISDIIERKKALQKADEDIEAMETEEEPISKPGEVYELGPHRLMCGSATDPSHIQKLMGEIKADMIFTDPPYNIGYVGSATGKRKEIANDKMSTKDFETFLHKAIQSMMNASHDHAPFYICMSQKELGTLKSVFEQMGGHWQSYIIWVKNHFTLGGSDYQRQYEPILYGWKEGKERYFIDDRTRSDIWESLEKISVRYDKEVNQTEIKVGTHRIKIDGKATGEYIEEDGQPDIWRFDRPTLSIDHPTMKPLDMIIQSIINSSKRGGVILDIFGGSGSTLIAAHKTDRVCYMMELSPQYCDVIRKRYAKEIGEVNWIQVTPTIP